MDNQIKQPNSHLGSPDSAIILYTTGCPLCHVLEAKL